MYLFEREQEQVAGRRAKGEGETDSPLSREPASGLNPRTPRSWPEQKADT